PVRQPENDDGGGGGPLARGGDAQEGPGLGAGAGEMGDDLVALGDDILDVDSEIGDADTHHLDGAPAALGAGDRIFNEALVKEVGREHLIDEVDVATIPGFREVASYDGLVYFRCGHAGAP